MGPHQHHDHAGAEFGADYWEDRYRAGEGGGRHEPSPSLVREAGALPPGRALDAGCGRGADAIWLAQRGWQVLAVDISDTALSGGRETARAAGPEVAQRITWERVDLTTWTPGDRRFDLVTSHYVHVPGPAQDLFGRLASWVAPGGTLLVAGHDDAGHRHPTNARIGSADVTTVLPEDGWEVLVAEARTHEVRRPDGSRASRQDVVVRARRSARP